uniref:Uncharacterized protein n=1 Tax=Meloidogyne javanica TaxID=6303 RepID=A0A915M8N5_MELJA
MENEVKNEGKSEGKIEEKKVENKDEEKDKIEVKNEDNLTLCPEKPPNLKGKIDVDMRSLKLEEIEEEYKDLWPGGHWRPKECKSRQKVAIVVPYRNREPHLRTFLHNIHRSRYVFRIRTIMPDRIRSIMLDLSCPALRVYPFDCIIFNDVDTYPENDNLLYRCSTNPKYTKHLSVYLERGGYKELYADFVGGVLALTVDQLRRINGYSNDFWGWGGEDDDFNTRVKLANMSFQRNKTEISRFRTFKHGTDHGNDPH